MTVGMCSQCFKSNLVIDICFECANTVCKDCKTECC